MQKLDMEMSCLRVASLQVCETHIQHIVNDYITTTPLKFIRILSTEYALTATTRHKVHTHYGHF